LLRATAALENFGIVYAVIGGNAVAAWVGQVDQSAVRFTQDVDLLILRSDLDATKAALQGEINVNDVIDPATGLPLKFPDAAAVIHARAQEFRRL
jgi:hypothetical protein